MKSVLIAAAAASIMFLPTLAPQQSVPVTQVQGREVLRELVDMGYSSRRDDEHRADGLHVALKLHTKTSSPGLTVRPVK